MKVFIVGGSGMTGRSIIDGLLESSTAFEIIALSRPSSLNSAKNQALRNAGVSVVSAECSGSEAALVQTLQGADVVISAVSAYALKDQIPLATAAKKAGVKRFVPCSFATVTPPRGVMKLAEIKDDVLAHVKSLYLPYTTIDVGWWQELAPPRVPSGRLDDTLVYPPTEIIGNGNVPSALTHRGDTDKFVARIITDDRTLNKQVFAYGSILTQHEIWNMVEKVSGEKLERNYVSREEIDRRVAEARKVLAADPDDMGKVMATIGPEYYLSWGIRGYNTPEYAKYLGYLNAGIFIRIPSLKHSRTS
ncbi:isoflavone reductase-like protein [Colletotrichum liriopes]|uniref:Isoflavone reductase-like protein n=1 Tax=Colletotrichum liriopes TaxID=708192 RepID=A0AA37LVG4_9PEZI|nr:isoflavone reductase-like protein [Colletotrichum liriopes]